VNNGGYPGWNITADSSRWISTICSGAELGVGPFLFATNFTVPQGTNLNSLQLSGQFMCDDGSPPDPDGYIDVILNGTQIITHQSGSYGFYSPFTLTSGFAIGSNTLQIRVYNVKKTAMGLRVKFYPQCSGSATACCGCTSFVAGTAMQMDITGINIVPVAGGITPAQCTTLQNCLRGVYSAPFAGPLTCEYSTGVLCNEYALDFAFPSENPGQARLEFVPAGAGDYGFSRSFISCQSFVCTSVNVFTFNVNVVRTNGQPAFQMTGTAVCNPPA
jgi:hypothetical protein